MNMPVVSGLTSIIIPCWNQPEFTRKCIASLFRQTGPNWELIVVNNGSTDATADYLGGIQDCSPVPVTVIANATNRGFPAAINQGLQHARGEYLVLLNNDVRGNMRSCFTQCAQAGELARDWEAGIELGEGFRTRSSFQGQRARQGAPGIAIAAIPLSSASSGAEVHHSQSGSHSRPISQCPSAGPRAAAPVAFAGPEVSPVSV